MSKSQAANLSSTSLWSGLLSVILAFAYYLIPLGIILSLIAIFTGSKARNIYNKNTDDVDLSVLRNATIGWICGIAGLTISILWGAWYLIPGVAE